MRHNKSDKTLWFLFSKLCYRYAWFRTCIGYIWDNVILFKKWETHSHRRAAKTSLLTNTTSPAVVPVSETTRLVPYQLTKPTIENWQNKLAPSEHPTIIPLVIPTLRANDRHCVYLQQWDTTHYAGMVVVHCRWVS